MIKDLRQQYFLGGYSGDSPHGTPISVKDFVTISNNLTRYVGIDDLIKKGLATLGGRD
jgi:hypothetical protein